MITQEEWSEMNALKNAINDNPASVHPDKMERFTELFVKSISKASDNKPILNPNYTDGSVYGNL